MRKLLTHLNSDVSFFSEAVHLDDGNLDDGICVVFFRCNILHISHILECLLLKSPL